MTKPLVKIVRSRYVHLSLGLLFLYGLSWNLTYVTRFEKILDSLYGYCCSDYEVTVMRSKRSVDTGHLHRERYAERLYDLTSGLFDWKDSQQAREFFMSKGYVFEVSHEGKRFRSYLLAPVLYKGTHAAENPQKVTFRYYVLGYKAIPTFLEYLDEKNTSCLFVSAANKVIDAQSEIYIHRDRLAPSLERYFDYLWEKRPQKAEDFYARSACPPYSNLETHFLYLDLRSICEEVFIEGVHRNRKEAKDYFVIEGFEIFVPTLLVMGARMAAADQDLKLSSGHRYLRALFTGLSLRPNHTMFYLSRRYRHYDPSINKTMKEFRQRSYRYDPANISLDEISRIAQEMLNKLDGPATKD